VSERYWQHSDDEALVSGALQAAYPPTRSVFSQRRGEQIVRAAAVEQANRTPLIGSRVAACVAASFVLLAGTAGAASAALPGQPLYQLKQIVERAMVAVTTDDVEAARLELRFAERRLEEASAVTEDEDTLTQRFNEHINAATVLAGDEVAGEVQHLRDTHEYSEPEVAVAPPRTPPAAEVAPPLEVASPSPSPSPSASPSPVPSETASSSEPAVAGPAPSESEPPRAPLGELAPPAMASESEARPQR
jgi:uncharacterized protein DUF5667